MAPIMPCNYSVEDTGFHMSEVGLLPFFEDMETHLGNISLGPAVTDPVQLA